jgi:hypothetical protein
MTNDNLINKIEFKYVNYKGKKVYIGFIGKNGGYYKVRVQIMVIKDDKIFFAFGEDPKGKSGWFPGGGLEVNTIEETKQDIPKLLDHICYHESQEEIRITCKKWINTGYYRYYTYKPTAGNKDGFPGCPKIIKEDGTESNSDILGSLSFMYIGVYDKPYTGKIAKRDQSPLFSKGTFYTYEEIEPYLTIEEKEAIKAYNPNIVKISNRKFSWEDISAILSYDIKRF